MAKKVVKLMIFAHTNSRDNNRTLVFDCRNSSEEQIRKELNLGNDWSMLCYETKELIGKVVVRE